MIWGTKGDNTATMDLGVASKAGTNEKGVEAVEVELYDGIDTIDKNYERALDNLSSKPQLIHNSRAPKTKQDDYYRGFRTRLVLTWIGCNAVLVACVTSNRFQSMGSLYTGCILWTVAVMAAFRFLGSLLYLILRCFRL
ncbi:hypothetical protein G6F68_014114 [Rhizopus microsporus]|nr:hypothetical protein G6F68_014114 [Rhizopus microsporus]